MASPGLREAAHLIVEAILEEEPESVEEIAADFVENELGRFDWMRNWAVIKGKEDPVAKVKAYLDYYGLRADPQQIVDEIERLVEKVPGRWK